MSSVGTVSTRCMGATAVDRQGASDYASSFVTAFMKSLGFKRTLVRSDSERSLLSLIERGDVQFDGCRVGADDVSRRGSSSQWPCRGRCS